MNRGRRSWAMRRTKILRASRFQQNRPRRADGNVRKGRIDVVGVDKLDRLVAQLISEFERHNWSRLHGRSIAAKAILPAIADAYSCCSRRILNAVLATAFSGQVLASPSFSVASVKL